MDIRKSANRLVCALPDSEEIRSKIEKRPEYILKDDKIIALIGYRE